MKSRIEFVSSVELLRQNDFVRLAKAIRQPENRTKTSIRIDLSTGECWIDVEGLGESHVYDSDTIIILLWHIELIAKRVMQMYADGVSVERIEFDNLEAVRSLSFDDEKD